MSDGDTSSLDPILLEVVRYKLDSIVEEMQFSLIRGAFSPIVKEALDASASLFRADGTVVAQSRANPSHLGSLIFSLESILAAYPAATMQEGDIYILNDPYLGGTHLPDIAVVMPVVGDGRVVALTATMAHHVDVGGVMAGSVPTNATEIFQEGVRIPAVRLARAGIVNDELLRTVLQNVRLPATLRGDLDAQIAACKIATRRVHELGARHGYGTVTGLFDALIERSERMTRAALAALPAGHYRYVDYLDNDGIELDRRLPIVATVTLGGGELAIDFTGTCAQVRGPLNIVRSGVYSAAYYAVRAITDPEIPTNGGCFRPVRITLPEGSLVNPTEPAAVNARTATMKRIASTIVGAIAQVLPTRFPAASAASVHVLAFGGAWPDGRRFVCADLVNGGSGAADRADGVDAIATDMTNGRNIPAEAMEEEAPIRVLRSALRRDSGGAGKRRGGLGVVREYEMLAGPVSLAHRGERHFAPAPGLAGGGPGAAAQSEIHRRDGTVEVIRSKCVTTLQAGDRLVVMTPGGGGYGDPVERPQALLRDDVADGKVGATTAASDAFAPVPAA